MRKQTKIFRQIAGFFLPNRDNDYHPYGLRRAALFSYSIFLLIVNMLGSTVDILGATSVSAATIATSRLVTLANQERSAAHLSELVSNSQLQLAAKRKAEDMFEKGYWSHYGPNGETPWQFILGSGYSYTYAGENLAKDFVTTDAIHAAWMASPTHRANILKPQYKDIGIAAVSGMLNGDPTTIVVQMFGLESTTESSLSGLLPATSDSDTTAQSDLTPEIISPEEGKAYNDEFLNIKGKGKEDSEITVFDGDRKIGTLSVEGGVFDYRPEKRWQEGDHEVSSQATDVQSGVISGLSNYVGFSIDTQSPQIKGDSLNVETTVLNNDVETDISVEASKDAVDVRLIIGEEEFPLYSNDNKSNPDPDFTLYSAVIDVSLGKLRDSGYSGILRVTDNAGNSTEEEILLDVSEGVIAKALGVFSESASVFTDAVNRYKALSIVSKINLAFAGFISVLFTTDALALWKMGIIRDGAKSLLSAFIFVVAILVSVFVGSGSAII